MSEEVAERAYSFEAHGALFIDIRITEKTAEAVEEWRRLLEADGAFMSRQAAFEDLCLYALSVYYNGGKEPENEEEEAEV